MFGASCLLKNTTTTFYVCAFLGLLKWSTLGIGGRMRSFFYLFKQPRKASMFGASCLLKYITTTSHVCGFLALFGLFEIGHQSSGGVLPLSA